MLTVDILININNLQLEIGQHITCALEIRLRNPNNPDSLIRAKCKSFAVSDLQQQSDDLSIKASVTAIIPYTDTANLNLDTLELEYFEVYLSNYEEDVRAVRTKTTDKSSAVDKSKRTVIKSDNSRIQIISIKKSSRQYT